MGKAMLKEYLKAKETPDSMALQVQALQSTLITPHSYSSWDRNT